MTTRRDILLALAERAEGATCGSHALDCEIARGLGWRPDKTRTNGLDFWWPADVAERARRHKQKPEGRPVPLPAWSTSVDDALTLVPEGWSVSLDIDADGSARAELTGSPERRKRGGRSETVWPLIESGSDGQRSKSPALAICAAALRALAAQEQTP